MYPRLRSSRAALFFLACLSPCLLAEEPGCDKRSSERASAQWRYPLPARDTLPSLTSVSQAGAWVILDEMRQNEESHGETCTYSRLVYLGNSEAVERFGSQEIRLGKGETAVVKGRVQQPDGKVRELRDEDLACSDTRPRHFLFFQRKSAARRMIIHYPELSTGAVVQQQVTTACRLWDWDSRLHHIATEGSVLDVNMWSGTQDYLSAERDATTRRYPAVLLRLILLRPVHYDYKVRLQPEKNSMTLNEYTTNWPTVHQIVIRGDRPAVVNESFAPPFNRRAETLGILMRMHSAHEQNWDDVISAAVHGMGPDKKALKKLLARHPEFEKLPPMDFARAVNGFFRDDPAAEDEEFGSLFSVLKARGLDAYLVGARTTDRRPADRDLPSTGWFNRELVAVMQDAQLVYFDPDDRIAGGALSQELQGAEAILIRGPKSWKWISLPISAAGENVNRIRFSVHSAPGGILYGTAAVTLSGTRAEHFRDEATGDSPAALEKFTLKWLDEAAAAGLSFNSPKISNLTLPDLSLEITADFEWAGGLKKRGTKSILSAFPWLGGPRPNDLIAERRATDIEFGPPATFITEMEVPVGWMQNGPARSSLDGPGIHYQQEASKGKEHWTLSRALTREGLHAVKEYPEIRSTLLAVAEADGLSIEVTPVKASDIPVP